VGLRRGKRSERRILGQGHGIRRALLASEKPRECAIDVSTREDDRAPSDVREVSDSVPGLVDERDHVDDDVRREGAQLVHVRVERGEVPVDMPDGRRELGLRRSAVEDGDVVPILDQRAHDPGADEARAAEEQYVHRSSGRYSVSTWPATARYAPEPCKEGGSRWGTVRTSPSGS
jgi:hypothetical protein